MSKLTLTFTLINPLVPFNLTLLPSSSDRGRQHDPFGDVGPSGFSAAHSQWDNPHTAGPSGFSMGPSPWDSPHGSRAVENDFGMGAILGSSHHGPDRGVQDYQRKQREQIERQNRALMRESESRETFATKYAELLINYAAILVARVCSKLQLSMPACQVEVLCQYDAVGAIKAMTASIRSPRFQFPAEMTHALSNEAAGFFQLTTAQVIPDNAPIEGLSLDGEKTMFGRDRVGRVTRQSAVFSGGSLDAFITFQHEELKKNHLECLRMMAGGGAEDPFMHHGLYSSALPKVSFRNRHLLTHCGKLDFFSETPVLPDLRTTLPEAEQGRLSQREEKRKGTINFKRNSPTIELESIVDDDFPRDLVTWLVARGFIEPSNDNRYVAIDADNDTVRILIVYLPPISLPESAAAINEFLAARPLENFTYVGGFIESLLPRRTATLPVISASETAHQRLLMAMNSLQADKAFTLDLSPAIASVNEHDYGQALRRICTVKASGVIDDALQVMQLLLSHKDDLGFTVDDRSKTGKTALSHAVGKPRLISALEEAGASDMGGATPAESLENAEPAAFGGGI